MLKNIDLIIYDFDGVMTDNRVLVFADGKEAVFVNRSDGLAIRLIKKIGIPQIIISTETNKAMKARAKKLALPLFQTINDKKKIVKEFIKKKNIPRRNVIFVGNDINDQEAMKFVGIPIAPADASIEIKKIAKIVLTTKGGYGVIRELLGLIRESHHE